MHGIDPDPLISISAAAARLGIDRSVLSRQIKAGQVRAHGKNVRLSEVLADRAANIDLTRSGRRDGRGEHEKQHPRAPRASSRASDRASPDARPLADEEDEAPDEGGSVWVDGQLMTTAQARAMKETYLALMRKLQFEVADGHLVNRAAAEAKFHEKAKEFHDALLAWPARVAIEMAEELKADPATGKVDFRILTMVLSRYVKTLLAEMGDTELPEWKAAG